MRGVDETLERTDTNYRLMLNDFSKSINTYKDDIYSLEQLFVNATTTGRLLSLQERLAKKRDGEDERYPGYGCGQEPGPPAMAQHHAKGCRDQGQYHHQNREMFGDHGSLSPASMRWISSSSMVP